MVVKQAQEALLRESVTLLEPALRQLGLRQLVLYPSTLNPETLFEPGEALLWGIASTSFWNSSS